MTTSAARLIREHADRFPAGLVVGDVGMADIDWRRFNLIDPQRGDPCHPTVYGYARIADYLAALLRTSGTWDRAQVTDHR